jgi:hypothetical protein
MRPEILMTHTRRRGVALAPTTARANSKALGELKERST